MTITALRRVEHAIRSARDRLILRPLAASRWIQRHAHDQFDLVVQQFGDHRIAFDPADKVIGHHIAKFGDWFRADFHRVLDLLAQAGRPTRDRAFLDVGANIGTQTVYALIGRDFARAVCFEPAPRNITALKTNLVVNGLDDRAIVVPSAVGAADGRLQLTMDGDNSGAHSFRRLGTAPKSSLDVDVTTIDAALAKLRIDAADIGLLWLDVEGYEPEALSGAKDLLAARVPICVEFNSTVYGEAGTAALLDRLAGLGYRTATAITATAGRPQRTFAVSKVDPEYLPGDLLFL